MVVVRLEEPILESQVEVDKCGFDNFKRFINCFYSTPECITIVKQQNFILGESGDRSLVVSLEINSIMYQGVLFAQPTSSHLRGKQAPNSSANNTNNLSSSNLNERKDNRIS